VDPVGAQRDLHRLNDGNPACHAPLEPKIEPPLRSHGHQVVPLFGEQLLVRRYHILAIAESTLNISSGRLDAADQFRDNVDLGVVDDIGGIGGDE